MRQRASDVPGRRRQGVRTRVLASVLVAAALAAGIAVVLSDSDHPSHEFEFIATRLPGAPPLPAELFEQLEARRTTAEGPFRTRHVGEDGHPIYANRLLLESSPYLAQHAHNPVNWFPWGDEAFALAEELGRPVLLSVGYATCHWCHVMEEESFEDPAIAELINSRYIPIKLDREERPDLDAIYMTAVQGFTGGRGGWPMTLWLTPKGEPFYGATYVPPEDGMRGRPTGLRTMLTRLADLYEQEPEKVVLTTLSVRESIEKTLAAHAEPSELAELPEQALSEAVSRDYDAELGGLKGAPKFPSHMPLRPLLRMDGEDAQRAEHTLEAMAAGGIYDHLGGGFHRYSVDARWRVPHFEKMLYDNALLAIAYTEAAQRAGDVGFERVARETLDMLLRDFELEDGGFASALDADSLDSSGKRVEGAFYTWTPSELADVLSPDQAKSFAAAYGVTAPGDLEGRSVLHTEGLLDPEPFEAQAASRQALFEARARRSPPLRDEKVIADLNGLAIRALALAGRVFDEPRYTEAAERTAGALWERQVREGRLARVWTHGGAAHDGQLTDYAFVAAGLVELFESTGDKRWLERAMALDDVIGEHFVDAKTGGYFESPDDGEGFPGGAPLTRKRSGADSSLPAGASVHALTLLKLGELTGRDGYRDRAQALVELQSEKLRTRPTAYAELFLAADWLIDDPREIVLVGKSREQGEALREVLREHFLPSAVFVDVTEAQARELDELCPLVRDRGALGGEATAYVCQGGVCQQPVTEPDVLREQLERL
ncbi:MAG: thioredoxin domain-containing protein [Deltaproteobacteria bacterium]|nr:MAG: thioredoxin domain-containing protein [Deltaproteobacteria bacterium]